MTLARLALAPALFALAACADLDGPAGDRARGPAAPTSAPVPEVLATVGGDVEIRLEDLPAQAREQLAQLDNAYRQQRYEFLKDALDETIAERLLAAEAEARGVTPAQVVAAATDAPPEPTDAQVEAWYGENQSRLQGRSLDELREQIRSFLRQAELERQTEALDRELRAEHGVVVHLDPYRVQFDHEGSPALGPADAAVTLVEFSDFECPFCGRFFSTLERVENDYGDRIRIVYRQFPIPSLHPSAFKAAEASLCAHEQGEFWPYHDLLFAEQDRLAVRDLKEKAGRLGLDEERFGECLDTGRYVEQVQDDQAAGRAAGVTGTPALFVNGIPIPGGAVAYEVVAAALDEELARTAD